MYNNVAPILNPKTTIINPNHLPKIKPPNKAIGEPKPNNGKTQKIVNKRNSNGNISELEFLSFEK